MRLLSDLVVSLIPLVVLAAALFSAGCESDGVSPLAKEKTASSIGKSAPETAKATPSANVSKLQAWKDAELIASLGEGRLEVIGTGDSMAPVYGESTILVISRIPFDDLQPGMTVAYANLRGHRVVHQLLAKERAGWRIQGFNNEVEDKERVSRENLIGVVYASLAYDPKLK
jgi:hypothetical protein